MRHKVQLKFQFEQASVLQMYETLALVVSQAFGGKKSSGGHPLDPDEAPSSRPDQDGEQPTPLVPKNFDQFMASMRATMGVSQNG